MHLSDTAARVMTLAQGGRPDQALALGTETLRLAEQSGAPASDVVALWYAVAVAEHVRNDGFAQIEATSRCLELARALGEPGWASNALSLRAMALVRANTVEPALLDLAQAELELAAATERGLVGWAHTGLGLSYLELRLYELAEPHFEAALSVQESPLPLPEERAIDLANLAELHLRWADELERAEPHDGYAEEVGARRVDGHAYAEAGIAEAERVDSVELAAACRSMELRSRPQATAEHSLPELRAAWENPAHADHLGGRATAGAALSRALWLLGRRDEALEVARAAAAYSRDAGDWHVTAAVQWLHVELEAEAGTAGAAAGREYSRLLSRVLWQQRLSTLQGATAALDVEHLRHDKLAAQRAAHEDALTGAGNRRALEAALDDLAQLTLHDHLGSSLLVVDLDEFKAVNDRHGHVVGDRALRAVADAIRSVARQDDVVARLGGDEFVVLAHGTDAGAGAALADRVRQAISEIAVPIAGGTVGLTAAVGVATTDLETSVPDLLDAADRAMYADKRRPGRT